MDSQLPDGTRLSEGFALQHPQDYIESLSASVKGAVLTANISPDEVGGIGVDFTSSTVLPIDKNGTPLAFYDEFKNEPHAYVKLWKHHASQKYADMLIGLIDDGFAAAIYTQTTDVEIEANGLMTYDRKVIKVEADRIREINLEICHSLDEK